MNDHDDVRYMWTILAIVALIALAWATAAGNTGDYDDADIGPIEAWESSP